MCSETVKGKGGKSTDPVCDRNCDSSVTENDEKHLHDDDCAHYRSTVVIGFTQELHS